MKMNVRDEFYKKYFDSQFKVGNILNRSAYEKAASDFEAYYCAVLPPEQDANILDIGCGTGHLLYYLQKKGYRNVRGIDISPQQVDFCRRRVTELVEVADASGFLAGRKSVFKVIFIHDVLEHIVKDELLSLLRLIHAALCENGILIARVPNMSNPFSLDSRYRDFTHEIGYTEKSLYQVLSVAGFGQIQIESTRILGKSAKRRVRRQMVNALHSIIRFLYYIQDFSVPDQLGKNLIAICCK